MYEGHSKSSRKQVIICEGKCIFFVGKLLGFIKQVFVEVLQNMYVYFYIVKLNLKSVRTLNFQFLKNLISWRFLSQSNNKNYYLRTDEGRENIKVGNRIVRMVTSISANQNEEESLVSDRLNLSKVTLLRVQKLLREDQLTTMRAEYVP